MVSSSTSLLEESRLAVAVRDGLGRSDRRLPAWLLYDDEGSRLYDAITRLPEYYPARVERSILAEHADGIVELVRTVDVLPIHVAELGAGTASKSQLVVSAVAKAQGETTFLATDVSKAPLDEARARFAREEPRVAFHAFVGHHEQALGAVRALGGKRLVLFLGGSIGNFERLEAHTLLRALRSSLDAGSVLLLGTDLRKNPEVLVHAYDDSAGVTAAFNKNVLERINRELGADFDPDRFRHVALWNASASRVEMHLESTCDQAVSIDGIGQRYYLRRGERIHTESSVKYDGAMANSLLEATGFIRERTFFDRERLFAVHLARASWPSLARPASCRPAPRS
jgi:dimethylhistidine N-methyltransferase